MSMDREDFIHLAKEAGFDTDLPPFKDGTAIALKLARLVASASRSAEREACLDVIKTHRIPVGNSSAGEMACEWTYEALKEISAAIRARGQI